MRRLRIPLMTFALLSAIGAPLPAEQEKAPLREVFHDRIGVEIVNIDVVVTDKKGRAVEGLTAEHFELRIDGQEVPIANFYAVTADSMPSTAPVEAVTVEAAEAAPPPPSTPVHLVAYVDSFYLTPISRKRVLRDLPAFFEEQVASGARVMLVTRDQTTRVLTPFTSDLDEIRRALEAVDEAPAVGVRQKTAYRSVQDNVRSIYQLCAENPNLDPCEDCLEQMVEQVRFYSLGLISERRGAMAALGGIVNALSVIDGKKALLYVSDGIQQQTGVDLFFYIGDQLCPQKRQEFQEHYLRIDVEDLNELVAQANASRVTLYALEAAGLRNFSSASAEYADQFFVPSAQNDMIRIANLQGTLHYLSEETGGKAVLNANRFAPDLAKLGGELRTYYSLGYQPGHSGRGRPHRVGVKVRKKAYQLRYRRSFLHKLPEQQLADRALGAVMFGVSENPLAAEVTAGTVTAGGEDRVVIPLEVRVPTERLSLVPQDGARLGRLLAIVTAPDKKGKKTAVRRKEIDVTLPLAPEPDEHYRFGVNVELVPGDYQLGVGLWDEISATGSFLSLRVDARPNAAPPPDAP